MVRSVRPVSFLTRRHRPHPLEALPWAIAAAAFFVFPDYMQLGSQILIMAMFALSLDLVLGFAGIVTLGHAALFGVGAYAAGIVSVHGGWNEPLSGLMVAGASAALVGLISGWVILRTHGLTLLMLTIATAILLHEFANEQGHITGGANGLSGIRMDPLFGMLGFDFYGRTGYVYALAALLISFLLSRAIVFSPFGQSLKGIRENEARMHAIGALVHRRKLIIYTISSAMAGVAGGLLAQTTQFVGDDVLSFGRSADVLIMLILGGTGRLYGALVGAPVYMVIQDQLAKQYPEYWQLGIGLMLVVVVLFARDGIIGMWDKLQDSWRRRSA
ncbi:MAG: branched-chain amino acid ABC transporter permease [Pseudorhodoplanes sp.]|nr:branched-chain amino acid ABC transporter permease [Pseudorhodoplanes sp.]